MTDFYQVELVFIRFHIKKDILSDSNLTMLLIQSEKNLSSQQKIKQKQQLALYKNQRVKQLDEMKSFRFILRQPIDSQNPLTIKYEIKGTGEQRIRSIPIDFNKIINYFENLKRTSFEETFGGQNQQVLFRFYIKKNQITEQHNILVVGPNQQQNNADPFRSSSIHRNKRPPNLMISKSNKIAQHQLQLQPVLASPSSSLGIQDLKAKLRMQNQKESSVGDSPLPTIKKGQSGIPISDIEKVNNLMNSHQRPKQQHGSSALSYKLKIVFAMIIFGILFLVYDTFSDKPRRQKKKINKNHHNHHNHGSSKISKPKHSH